MRPGYFIVWFIFAAWTLAALYIFGWSVETVIVSSWPFVIAVKATWLMWRSLI